jgi:hypothetical protein
MEETIEWFKVLGVNTSVFAAVSLDQLETTLSIVALTMTAVWTGVKIWKLLKSDEKEN